MDKREFNILLKKAQSGSLVAQHSIWLKICHNQTQAFFKADPEYLGLGYITFKHAITQYNPNKLPEGKCHRYQFPAYYKNKLRFAMQTERRQMKYPVKASRYQLSKGQVPIKVQVMEALANV